jgi:hypothetical protein
MAALRETVLRRNVFDWTLDVLDTIVGLGLQTPGPDGTRAEDRAGSALSGPSATGGDP